MTMLRVRVELADIPGALAAVATALSSLGVDVAAIDVLEVDGLNVVDEMLLRLPPGVTAQQVRDVIRLSGAVDVLSTRVDGSAGDPAVTALALACAAISGPADDGAGQALAKIAYADVGALVDIGDARRFPLAARAVDAGVPASGPVAPNASPLMVSTGWVLWVAPQCPSPARLAVVARRLNVRFSSTEAARLRAFATLLETASRVAS